MVCEHCGRENVNNDKLCAFCRAELDLSNSELAASESMDYESNLGFAKADALYEAPQVMEFSSGVEHTDGGRIKSRSNDKAVMISPTHKDKEDLGEQDGISRSDLKQKKSKRYEKKLLAQRQQRLYEELKNRLQEEKQESLSRYMYQGLNQDIVDDSDEAQKKKHRDKSFLLAMVGIAAGILITAGLLLYIGGMSERTDYQYITKDAIEVHSSQTEGKTYVFNSMGDMLYKLNGSFYVYYTPDHSAAVLYNWSSKKYVYVNAYRRKDFDTTVYNFVLSKDGNYILYSVAGSTNKYYLKLYDIIQDKETMLDNQAKHFDMMNITPGGKTITYITYSLLTEGSINELQSFIIHNSGTPELLGKDMFVFAISEDLSSIYYGKFVDGNMSTIAVRHNGEDKKLSDGINGVIHVNQDYSEMLVEDGGSYYLYLQGEERRKIIDQHINRIVMPEKGITNMKMNGIMCYGLQSFREKVLICNDNSIKCLDKNLQIKDIGMMSDSTNVTISKDGSTLIYIDTQKRLIKVTDIFGKIKHEVLAYEVLNYKVSKNVSRIYYLQDSNLYYIEKNKAERLISEKVRELYSNGQGDTVFFLKYETNSKDTLYYCENGLTAVAVDGGTNVTGVKEWNFGVIYQKLINNNNVVFYNREGTEFEFIMDGIDLLEENTLN